MTRALVGVVPGDEAPQPCPGRDVAKRLTALEGQVVHFRDDSTMLTLAPGVIVELERLGGEVYRCRRLGATIEVNADARSRPKAW